MKLRVGNACLVLFSISSACSNPPTTASATASPDFRITIQEFYFAEGGQRLDYEIRPSVVRVKYAENFNSKESVLIWEANLVSEQRAELAAAVTRLDLRKLDESYDSGGFDGIQINFEFVIGQTAPKRVHIGNTNQPDLQEFVRSVNRFIQNAQFRVRENWEDDETSKDDEAMTEESSTTQESDTDTES